MGDYLSLGEWRSGKILLHKVDWKDMVLLPGQSKENTIFSLSNGQFEVVNFWVNRWYYWPSLPVKMARAPSEDLGTKE